MKNFCLYIIIFFCSGLNLYHAQNKYISIPITDTLRINFQNKYYFRSSNIIPFSETVHLRGSVLRTQDYSADYVNGFISLSDSLRYSVFDTLIITYRSLQLGLARDYSRRTIDYRIAQQSADTLQVMRQLNGKINADYFFGKDIQKSGSIARGFSLGTTKDFTLTSGLRLQLAGKLTDDIQITAALTDENSPIQPEGNTEKLDELDKVFIEIRHKNAVGTFGDYDYNVNTGEFGTLNRKLQGLKGEFEFTGYKGSLAFATSKGKFNSNRFDGQEGVQGPYRLTGVNNEREILVIAGSEKVFLNGEEMRRGEGNDYTIEYSNAEITFTPKRLITSASRIYVDFEYTDRRYSRNFFASTFVTQQIKGKLNVSVGYVREGDDESSPVDMTFSEEDKKVLRSAGDNRLLAARSGVTAAEPDSLGRIRGVYSAVDTVINNSAYTVYIYSPGTGKYYVTFSYVGINNGDYVKESLGIYRFAGKARGDYMPVQLLPLPELKQTGNILISSSLLKDMTISAELSGSMYDRNRFSALDDNDNSGYARTFIFDLKPSALRLFNRSFGKVGLHYKDRYLDKNYTTVDRLNQVEFNRYYNLSESSVSANEVLREFTLNLLPVDQMKIASSYGYLKKGTSFNSDRFTTDFTYQKNNISTTYNFDMVNSETKYSLSDAVESKWIRQSGSIAYTSKILTPSVSFSTEEKRNRNAGKDSLLSGSFKYFEIIPTMAVGNFHGLELDASYSYRAESGMDKGRLRKESDAYTQIYSAAYRGIKNLVSTLNFTLRDKKYTDYYKIQGMLDNQTILIRSQTRATLADRFFTGSVFYETSTQRSARLERVFVKVAQGTGNYRYTGDKNNNGIADETEFESVIYDGDFIVTTIPTEKLYPVIDLKAGSEIEMDFSRIFRTNGFWKTYIAPVSTVTSIRIDENSTEPDTRKIYMLNLSHFRNDSTTITGSDNFLQELYLFRNSSDISFRLRYNQKRGLNNYSSGTERTYYRERSLRVRFKLIEDVANQTDLANTDDNLQSDKTSNRVRQITSNSVSTDFSYHPIKNVEVGFKLSTAQSTDSYPDKPTIIDENGQTLRLNISFSAQGRLRIELERSELSANNTNNYIPFELTRGNYIGKNYFLRVNFDYNISGNLQMLLNYDGRVQGSQKPIHNAKAEARAYF